MAPLPAENILPIIFLLLIIFSVSKAELHAHYYDQTCPQVEKIISETVLKASKHDPKVPARILRMFFHDRIFGIRHEPFFRLHANTTSERNTYLTPLVTFLASCNKHLSP